MALGHGASIALAFRDWANTRAVYRFFSKDRINEEEILAGHFIPRAAVGRDQRPNLVLRSMTGLRIKGTVRGDRHHVPGQLRQGQGRPFPDAHGAGF